MNIDEKLIFDEFKEKYSGSQLVDIYQRQDFIELYNSSALNDEFDDINYYKNVISKQSTIIEVGSGTGRVLIPLFRDGYKIWGIEPSPGMIQMMSDKEAEKRVFQCTLQNIDEVLKKLLNVDAIIIPITTLSLFNYETVADFLKTAFVFSVSHIYFDLIDPSYFKRKNEQVRVMRNGDQTFVAVNFIADDKVIFNVADGEALGVSVKYLWTDQKIKEVFESNGYSLKKLAKEETENANFQATICR